MLCVLQVGGGFVGLGVVAAKLGGNAPIGIGEGLLFAALFVFGIAAGVALAEGSRWGRRASIAWWWLQLPALSSPYASYALWSGAMFSAGVNFSERQIGIQADWGAGFTFSLQPGPTVFAVNLCAVLALALLRRLARPEPDVRAEQPSTMEPS